jgi:ribonuclease Y
MIAFLTGTLGLLLGFGAGFLYRKSIAASNAMSIEARAQQLLLDTQRDADSAAKRAIQDAKDEASAMRREVDEDLRGRRDELARQEGRLSVFQV